MADEQDDPEVIRKQMEAQRASLAEKLDLLENKIVETVEGAREAVAETVQTVKDSVQSSVNTVRDTVQSSVDNVKETFDIRQQVQRRPWAMVGGSLAVGFVAGWLVNRAGPAAAPAAPAWSATPSTAAAGTSRLRPSDFDATPAREEAVYAAPSAGVGWVQQFENAFAPEIQKVKGLAIGAAIGLVRELIAQRVPEKLRPQVNDMIDNITTKLGGERVQGDLFSSILSQEHQAAGNGRH